MKNEHKKINATLLLRSIFARIFIKQLCFALYVSKHHCFLQKGSVPVALCVTKTPAQSLMQ